MTVLMRKFALKSVQKKTDAAFSGVPFFSGGGGARSFEPPRGDTLSARGHGSAMPRCSVRAMNRTIHSGEP